MSIIVCVCVGAVLVNSTNHPSIRLLHFDPNLLYICRGKAPASVLHLYPFIVKNWAAINSVVGIIVTPLSNISIHLHMQWATEFWCHQSDAARWCLFTLWLPNKWLPMAERLETCCYKCVCASIEDSASWPSCSLWNLDYSGLLYHRSLAKEC
jgi:hypothetical protein